MKRALTAALVALAATGAAQANTLGPFSGNWDVTDPTQMGRIFRDAIPSDPLSPKPWPGSFADGSTFYYEIFEFTNNDPAGAVTVDVTVSSTNTHFAAFSGQFYDTTFANNQPIYLGDVGSSLSQPFGFVAPTGSFMVVAMTTSTGDATGSFNFSVTGSNLSPGFVSAVPEPSTTAMLLVGVAGVAGFAARRRRTQPQAPAQQQAA